MQIREHLVQTGNPSTFYCLQLGHPYLLGILLYWLLNVLVGYLPLLDSLVIGSEQVHILALGSQPLYLVELFLDVSRL
jgi:hypothetical protein